MLVSEEIELLENGDGSDDQGDGYGELSDDHGLAEGGACGAGLEPPSQGLHRGERREEEGRIASGQYADQRRQQGDACQEERLTENSLGKILAGDGIQQGQSQGGQQNGQQGGQQGDHKRLGKKLHDQRAAAGTQGLPEPHIQSTVGEAGCGEVDEIDAGDEQDEECGHSEENHIGPVAGFRDILFEL